jgi:hypothetical protein
MSAIAEDWHEELREYPAWALQIATRWWMSAENEKRRQKPLPGDIAARARVAMGAVYVAESALRRYQAQPKPVQTDAPRPAPTPEQKAKADELVAQFARRTAQ